MVDVKLGWPKLTPEQLDFVRYTPSVDEYGVATDISAALGWYGSGKTTCAIARMIQLATLNPWRPEYGDTHPLIAVVAPTFRILRNGVLNVLGRMLPREIVLRKRGTPHHDWVLANGCRLVAWSMDAPLESAELVGLVVDECNHPCFEAPDIWQNLVSRVRDPHATRRGTICAGLPETGWVRERFDVPDSNIRRTRLFATANNPVMRGGTLEQIAEATASDDRDLLYTPGWRSPSDLLYRTFDPNVHIVRREGDPRRTTHIGFDFGKQSYAIFGQETEVEVVNIVGQKRWARGLLIVDELPFEGDDLEALCYEIKTRTSWSIDTRSQIGVDPTIRTPEERIIKRHFPDARIDIRDREDPFYSVETGVSNVKRALKDALGNVHLLFAASVHQKSGRRGVVHALQTYRRRSGKIIKDNTTDHAVDGLRYLVQTVLPLTAERPKSRVF